jgi:hypothetical protein
LVPKTRSACDFKIAASVPVTGFEVTICDLKIAASVPGLSNSTT